MDWEDAKVLLGIVFLLLIVLGIIIQGGARLG